MQRHVRGKMMYSDGSVYDGQFYYDIIQGEGLMEYSKESKYHGSWLNGLVSSASLVHNMMLELT